MKHAAHLLVGLAAMGLTMTSLPAPQAAAAPAPAPAHISVTTAPSQLPAPAIVTTPSLRLGTGARGQRVANVQYWLRKLGYFNHSVTGYYGSITKSAVKRFQVRHGLRVTGVVNSATYAKLKARAGGSYSSSRVPARCRTKGRVLCIDKTTRKLRYVVNGKVVTTMDARFGSSSHPTRNGTFRVFKKSYNHTSSIYHTWMPRAMFFSGGQAVHYSPDFAARGYNGASHGCVNIRNWSKINYVYSRVRVGDKVVVYWS